MSRRPGRRSFGFVPWLASLVVEVLVRTWRFDLVSGGDAFARLLEEKRPVVWCLWHNRIAAGAGLLLRRIVPSGMDLMLVSSPSRDGNFSAAIVAAHGVRVIRGSSSRGGARALLGVIRAIREHGTSPIMVPDGPRGPAYRIKPGTLTVAGKTGRPIVCVGLSANRAWVLGTWDRLILPKPFARISVAVAEPREVPERLAPEESEALCERFDRLLDGLTREAEAAAGATDPWAEGDEEVSAGG
jgi:lysophospholipid acyltransferase (LPLAT)-like uncharacterized protein